MKNNRNRAYLLSSESECYLFKHNVPYEFHYNQDDEFWIHIGTEIFEAPSTAFTFKAELTVHEKINARSHYAGLHFVNYIPYKYERLLRRNQLDQPYYKRSKAVDKLLRSLI